MHDRFSTIGVTEYEMDSQRRRVLGGDSSVEDPVQAAEDRLLSSLSSSASDSANGFAEQENWDRFAGFAIGLGSLYAQDVISYPFTVMRRQCQVNHSSLKYQLSPFSISRVMWRIRVNQGFGALWKGWASMYMVQGAVVASEIGISEALNLQREITKPDEITPKEWMSHLALKSMAMLLTMPFYSASLIDSVQCQEIDDGRTVLTFFKDAIYRLIGWYNSRGHGRLLPMYLLIAPSLLHGMLHYQLKSAVERQVISKLSKLQGDRGKSQTSSPDTPSLCIPQAYYTQLVANFLSSLIADVMLFPLETIVIRLHVQGTRTIIDDTDNGEGVVPLCTNYEGLVDCFKCIRREEGFLGFYKGFGALILQYAIQALIVKFVKSFLVLSSNHNSHKPKATPPD